MSAKAALKYTHVSESLDGKVGNTNFHLSAASGGHRASTTGKGRFTRVTFNPGNVGAALPKGKYDLAFLGRPYKHYNDGAVLVFPRTEVRKRYPKSKRSFDDFLIHAPGKLGSEGCIVPYQRQDAKKILSAFEKAYGKVDWTKTDPWHGTLEVVDEPIEAWKFKILRTIEHEEWKQATGIDWEVV